ncbi:tetratricopeptide repeat protein [Enterovibrio sp. ZSDZ35]|uniref:Tetratricopeptide repeat protein n=1 Tax=Enterovibrio qingdaonensis TaxID=2899818 RepID=A0ABT5QMH9_9GAMM|nr:tetratricopeptide repeat protein [Enterovibrio sp. ZSDZ35]MDD1782200.1 tetratricopeptide repeat protein [Enterovibrio sp. ZSDZ35]
MSELNKMLSDLASPNHNESTLSVAPTPSAWRFRIAKIALILSIGVLCVSGVVWGVTSHLSEDNQAPTLTSSGSNTSQTLPVIQAVEPVAPVTVASSMSPTQKVVSHDNDYVELTQVSAPKPKVSTPKPKVRALDEVDAKASQVEPAAAPVVPVSEPKPKATAKVDTVVPVSTSTPQSAVTVVSDHAPASSLTVETVELSGKELAAIAYEKAQKRTQVGDSKQAIALLKDAVNYHPNHIAAINQLAGLLYGRNQVRDAENVLRKGINANPTSSSLKLTLAKIYQQSNRDESALNVLLPPVNGQSMDDIRLVSIRAGLAQKLGHHLDAQNSYEWLTQIEPEQGRWWLGFAVSAERNADFERAKQSYQEAINAGGLSNQSMQFARQRLVYLNSTKGATNGH